MKFIEKLQNFSGAAFNLRVLPFFTFKFGLLLVSLFIFFKILGGRFDESLFSTAVRIILYYLVIDLCITYISRFIIYAYRKENKRSKEYVDNFIIGIKSIFSVARTLIFVFIVLFIFGVDLLSLFTSLSIIAVALVLTFKEYITNFLSGLFIMFSDRYQLKDYIEVNNFKGRITDITFQNVVLKTDSKNYVYVPNAILISSGVVNYSKEAIKTIKVEFIVDKSNFKKFTKLEAALKNHVKKEFSEIIPSTDSIVLKVLSLDKDSAHWVLEVYASKYTFKAEEEIKFKAMEFILKFLST